MRRFFVAMALCCAVTAGASSNGLVVLLTDYGTDSIYVGILKGAIYSKSTTMRIDAISNAIPPFDIVAGATILLEACAEFPPGTTFCCVVDPGVGTERKCVVLQTKNDLTFVAPDNGLLAPVAEKYGVAELREATNTAYWRKGVVSSTFHGRDIFGPVAASLANGSSVEDVGPRLDKLVPLDLPKASIEDGAAHGVVLREDPYGNLVSNLTPGLLEQLGLKRGDSVEITIGAATYVAPWRNTYSDVEEGERLVLVQSIGFVECAVNQGSMAEAIGEGLHAPVAMRKAP